MAAKTGAGMRRVLYGGYCRERERDHLINNKAIVTKTLMSGGNSLYYSIRAADTVERQSALPVAILMNAAAKTAARRGAKLPPRSGLSRPAPRRLLSLRCFPRTPLIENRRLCRCRRSHLLSTAESPGTPEVCRRFSLAPQLPILLSRKRSTNCGLEIPSGRGRKPRDYTATMLLDIL
ncbi:hypothetical protein NDU88_000048 [Pleurodeles waltl]|uniref:Uncharacterized protein n=1 Tax=Pleurodeles waltl TaxID=8319 RepID=A0AAV7UPZ2_PLEWA|nr:hypothetical protein NDU88_000048 [Pleurodeles waltl]